MADMAVSEERAPDCMEGETLSVERRGRKKVSLAEEMILSLYSWNHRRDEIL